MMDAYVQEVRKLENKFSGLEVHHVVREHNVGADILSKLVGPPVHRFQLEFSSRS
jgi:hypothetical protein